MSIFGASFQIGRSALAAYQAAISVTGQNIANVGNANYTRQTGRLAALWGGPVLGGVTPGAGVRMAQLQRHIDQAVETRLRLSLGSRADAEVQHRALTQIESLYNELSGQDLSTQLNNLFGAFGDLQATPQDNTARNLIIQAADEVIRTMGRQRTGLLDQVEQLNQSAEAGAARAGDIADEIAELNALIVQEEARSQSVAGPLRDRRDALLRELAEQMTIEVREQDNGSINVFVGGEPLVEFDRSRGFTVQRELVDGIEVAEVRFADNLGTAVLGEGALAGVVTVRDGQIKTQLDRLDALARGLIYEVNRVHTSGAGLVGWSQLTGAYAVSDPAAALNSVDAGLDFPVANGTFIVHVRDRASGQVVTRQIEVDLDGLNGDDTTLASLAAALNGVPGLNAGVTSDNRLTISADGGSEFWFSEDSSGALAALGAGVFFTGTTATDIDVNAAVRSDPRLIAASLSGELADGDNAGRLSRVSESLSSLLGSMTIQDYQAGSVSQLAVDAAAARSGYEAADSVYANLVAQRESVSGVSLDEEAINLTKFERAFQGAARFLTVVDDLSTEILSLVR